MNSSRAIIRSARLVQATPRAKLRQVNVRLARFESTSSTTKTAAVSGGSSGLIAGIAGGAVVFLAGYGYYHFSGAKSIVNAASQTKSRFDQITKSLQQKAPEPNELLKWFRSTATSYAAFIPGAKSYVDAAFNDLEIVEQKHRGEVNEIVSKAYAEMQEASKNGLSLETAQQTWSILTKYLEQLADLASDSASEILDNHPDLKEKFGGNLDQLKNMANQYGPEAKKELDQTYSQISDVLKGGIGVETINKIRQLVQDKTEKVKALGDKAWKEGMEKAKPYLDKSPEIKKIIEENADSLKNGNFAELYEKIKKGDTEDLQSYVKQAGEKAKNSGLGKNLEKYAKMIPGGTEILPKLNQLQQVARKHGDDAEKILKETYKEIVEVLTKKTEELEKTAEKAKKDAK